MFVLRNIEIIYKSSELPCNFTFFASTKSAKDHMLKSREKMKDFLKDIAYFKNDEDFTKYAKEKKPFLVD